jgi:hypothetical protein
MRVGVIQSCYVPWRGYFDFIASCDLFVVYDDVQYSSGGFRNRNRVKHPAGLKWLTVPVRAHSGMRIDEVPIGNPRKPWRDEHRRLLSESLAPAPFAPEALSLWEEGAAAECGLLSELNVRLLRLVAGHLGIRTPIALSSEMTLRGSGTERLLGLLAQVGASAYLSGPSARDYLDKARFAQEGIRLEYKSYDYPPYPQPWGAFEGRVTILDLIANCGRNAAQYLRSLTPAEVAVP